MSPRIDIDGFNLALEEGTGVATYARNLSTALGDLGAEVGVLYGREFARAGDPLLREIGFFDVPSKRPGWRRDLSIARGVAGAVRGVTADELTLSGRVIPDDFRGRLPHFDRLWNAGNLFSVANAWFDVFKTRLTVTLPTPPQVMHWTYPLPIRVKGAKNIYTLHDLVPLRLPHTTLDRKRRYLRLVRLLAAEADHLVTVSEASKRDIVDILGVTDDRVTNTYQAVHVPAALAQRTEAEVRAEVQGVFGLEYCGYFLFVGAIEPKKNVHRLLQAYLGAQVASPLVLVGKRAWKSEQEMRLYDQEDKGRLGQGAGARRMAHIDYVPLPMLVSLVRGAKALVMPSVYEGFGLPVLEAMQLGTPVITANTASLPELAGDAALLVDPYDPADIAAAIQRLDRDPALRQALSARGRIQAQRFSPAAYRGRLADLYGRLGVDLQSAQ